MDGDVESLYEILTRPIQHLTEGSPDAPSLSPEIERRLTLLVRIAEILGIDDFSFLSYSSAISRLSAEKLSLQRSLLSLEQAERELEDHLASVRHEEQLITQWTEKFQAIYASGEDAASSRRRRDALVRKAKEYQEELDAIKAAMPTEPDITVTQLLTQQDRLRKKEQEIKSKRAKIKAFQGLPPSLDLARLELRNARNEQMKLIQLREKLLDKMADGVA